MSNMALRNLTLASAKHLLSQGHISQKTHNGIVKKVKKPAVMGPAAPPPTADETGPGAFGSLNPVAGGGAGHYMSTTGGAGAGEDY
jgi:hypothetical protein